MSYRGRGGFRNTFSSRDSKTEGIRITVPNDKKSTYGRPPPRKPAGHDESIRITVGNERSQQSPSEKHNPARMKGYRKSQYLGGFSGDRPPRRKFQEKKDNIDGSQASSGNGYENRSRESHKSREHKRDRSPSVSYSSSSSSGSSASRSPDSRHRRSRSHSPRSSHHRPKDVSDLNLKGMPVTKAKDLILSHFPDLFDSIEGNLFKKGNSPDNSQDGTSLPLLPASTLPDDIDDEDAFLYGDEDEKKASVPARSASGGGEPAPSRYCRSPSPKRLTGLSALQQNYNKEASRKSRHRRTKQRERSESPKRGPPPLPPPQAAPPLPPPPQAAPPPPLPPQEDKKDLIKDPTIESILKSIGFNFELSKKMQREADEAKARVDTTSQKKPEEPKARACNPENPYVEQARQYLEQEETAMIPDQRSYSPDNFNYENREFEAMNDPKPAELPVSHGSALPPGHPEMMAPAHPATSMPPQAFPAPHMMPPGYAGPMPVYGQAPGYPMPGYGPPPAAYVGPPPPGYGGPPPPGYGPGPAGFGPPPDQFGPPGGPTGPPFMGGRASSRSRSRSPPGIWLDNDRRQRRSHSRRAGSRSPPRHSRHGDSRERTRDNRDNREYRRNSREMYARDRKDSRGDRGRQVLPDDRRRSDGIQRDDRHRNEGSQRNDKERSHSRDPRDERNNWDRQSVDRKYDRDMEKKRVEDEREYNHQHSRSSSHSHDQAIPRQIMQPPKDDYDRNYMSPVGNQGGMSFARDQLQEKQCSPSPARSAASSQQSEEPPHKRKIVVKVPEPSSIGQQKAALLDKLVQEDTKLARNLAERDYQDTQINILQKKIDSDPKTNPQAYELLKDFEERRQKISQEIMVLRTRQDSLKRKIDVLEQQERHSKLEETRKKSPSPEAKPAVEKKEVKKSKLKKMTVNYDYFDAGNHWCKHCNAISLNMHEFLFHLGSKKHQQKLDPYDRPWQAERSKHPKMAPTHAVATPVQGVEFMMTTQAFYCTLCKSFSGDNTCAEQHLKSDEHNEAYRRYIEENPAYVRHYTLEKAAGLSRVRSAEDPDQPKSTEANNEEEEEERLREDAEDYAREKERIKELRRTQQEEEREMREKKRAEFEKIVAEKRKKYGSGTSATEEDVEDVVEEKTAEPPSPAVTRRPMLLIGKMPGRKKKEEKKEEKEEDDKKGISIKLGANKNTTKKTSVLNILEAKKSSGAAAKAPALSKSALLERSQALVNAVKKRKIEEDQKTAEEQAPLDYEANIENFVRVSEEKARKAKQALEEMAREESNMPEDIPLPPPDPSQDPAAKEEAEDLAMLGIDKPDNEAADKVKAPPPVASKASPTASPTASKPAAATASAAHLGSIFYGAKQPNTKPAERKEAAAATDAQPEAAEEEEEEMLEEECTLGSDVEMLDECDEA